MELNNAFAIIIKRLSNFNQNNNFEIVRPNGVKSDEIPVFSQDGLDYVEFKNNSNGNYRVAFNIEDSRVFLQCGDATDDGVEYTDTLQTLFELSTYDERDARSLANELEEQLITCYESNKRKDFNKVKLPKSISKTAVKNGMVSYDTTDTVTKFVDLFPQFKDDAKEIMVEYDTVLPEEFFIKYGAPFVIQTIKSKDDIQCKKLFRLLNELYENGTNSAQDIVAVTILGEMKNDKALIEIADKYMCDYMKTPVHLVNEILAKNKGLSKKLENPPTYKPKKQKNNAFTSMLQGQPPQN